MHLDNMRILDFGENLQLPREKLVQEVFGRFFLVEDLAREAHFLRPGTVHIIGQMYSGVRTLADFLPNQITSLFQSVHFRISWTYSGSHM